MSGLAGAVSVLASLYLAARVKGLGVPAEEQPNATSGKDKQLDNTRLFIQMARDFIRRGDFNVATGDCDKAKRLLTAARAALSQAEAHGNTLQRTPDRRSVAGEITSLKRNLQELEQKVSRRCIVVPRQIA